MKLLPATDALSMRFEPSVMTQDSRKSLLAVFPVAPWPVRSNGISIRFYPLLRHLAASYDVDLLVLGDFRDSLPDDPLLREVRSVETHYFNRAPAPTMLKRIATLAKVALPGGPPYAYASYHSEAVFDLLKERVTRTHYDGILWVCPFYARRSSGCVATSATRASCSTASTRLC